MKNLKSLNVFLLCILCLFGPQIASAQAKLPNNTGDRTIHSLTQNWRFLKDPRNNALVPSSKLNWTTVNLPHTWNDKDVEDQDPGYYRGAGWYTKILKANRNWKDKQVYLVFDGANQETIVFVNGKKAGQHTGGYTRFVIPISAFLRLDGNQENTISVKVNNSFNKDIAPLSADFTFFGGLYRNVSLQVVNKVHFDDPNYGSDGVYVSTPDVSANQASLRVSGSLVNSNSATVALGMRNVVKAPDGRIISTSNLPLAQAKAGQRIAFNYNLPAVAKPILWSPEHPSLYTVTTSLVDTKTGKELDAVTNKTGMRWFKFDAEKGFYLNGKSYKLIGASRHQDYKGLGNAVPASNQIKDVQLLKSMGGNFLRIAHYPQDQSILKACDELGILASVEIPIVSEITENTAFQANAIRMQLEMIWQNYNHPSVIIWAYMNEILLKLPFKDNKDRQAIYIDNVRKLAISLENATRKVDPSRYTMISNHSKFDLYKKAGLISIPMIVGWNMYNGWYGGKPDSFGPAMDKIHAQIPDVPFIVTEFGADADPRIHAAKPERFDKSVEYAVGFHQVYLNEIIKRPFVAGAQVWNLADFSSETREETMPHINNKGLLTHDRQPKNTYYLYSAYLASGSYLKIGAAKNEFRSGSADKDNEFALQQVQVFSNLKAAELFVNGKSLGVKSFKDHLTTWNVPFQNGKNSLKVVSATGTKVLEDHITIDFKIQPELLSSKKIPFRNIAISLGDPRYFIDEANRKIWLPDQAYKPGSWGYIGGRSFQMEDRARQPYGTDKSIDGTSLNPLFQTQRVGLKEYRLDVPDGKYEITMYFVELAGSEMTTVLPYNLFSDFKKSSKEDRVFNVYLHNHLIVSQLDLPKRFGSARAVTRKTVATVSSGAGIRLKFQATTGKPVLNALEVTKLD